MDERRLWRLLDVGRSLITELEPEAVLERVLAAAREVTGARYAAIGVLDERRESLTRFLTSGIGEDAQRAIGNLPEGRGVLGVLTGESPPLRLANVRAHPQSYGFPADHPPMTTFLGVPIVIEGQAWGNLYLTEKDGGEFTDDDETAVVVLADWAAIAVANSRLYRDVRERRDQLERTNRGLETTTEISRALAGVTDLDRVLELVVKRSRALIDARVAEIALLEGDEFVIAAVAGEGVEGRRGMRLSVDDSVAGRALESGHLERIEEIGPDTFAYRELGARSALVTPMWFRDRPVGFLIVFDRLLGGQPFDEEDERLLDAFAASAAMAVATAQHAGDEALRRSLEASEQERSRWARELHDETLQQLGGVRVLLSAAWRSGDRTRIDAAVVEAIEHLKTGIGDLRSLITDLRPAALDEFGVKAALETLVTRVAQQSDAAVELEFEPDGDGEARPRYSPELEATVYRVVQEALNNVVKHAEATRVRVRVSDQRGGIAVTVRDDGKGFDPEAVSVGFGLLGMRERLALVGGTLGIDSTPDTGTTMRAWLPVVT